MDFGSPQYFVHVIIGPCLIFLAGALANYGYKWLKDKAKKEEVWVTPGKAGKMIEEQLHKCAVLFATPEDLEKLHRTIIDEMYNKFATREALRKIEQTVATLHDDFKSDMKDIKEQLLVITEHLVRGQ